MDAPRLPPGVVNKENQSHTTHPSLSVSVSLSLYSTLHSYTVYLYLYSHVRIMNNDEPSSSSSTQHHLRPSSPSTSSLYLSPRVPQYTADSDSDRAASPEPEPDSPSASTFLRTAATLDGLARQLGDLNHSRESSYDDDSNGKCCCGSLAGSGSRGCKTMIERDRIEERMKLGGGEYILFQSQRSGK